jgi:hypothetical protein
MLKKWNILILFVALFSTNVQADILYQQDWDNYAGYTSDRGEDDQKVADNFFIAAGGSITEVIWTGGYIDKVLKKDKFVIRFYSDENGEPGDILAKYKIGNNALRTDTGETFAAYDDPIEAYAYQYILPTPFNAAPGTTYWISILNGKKENWSWADAEMGNPNLVAFRDGNNEPWSIYSYDERSVNRAFELDGSCSQVPEPATLLFLGSGIVGLIGLRKRVKK